MTLNFETIKTGAYELGSSAWAHGSSFASSAISWAGSHLKSGNNYIWVKGESAFGRAWSYAAPHAQVFANYARSEEGAPYVLLGAAALALFTTQLLGPQKSIPAKTFKAALFVIGAATFAAGIHAATTSPQATGELVKKYGAIAADKLSIGKYFA